MAGSKFQYDESGSTFFYFLLSFLALVLIPCNYYLWPKSQRKDEKSKDVNTCHCNPCAIKSNYINAENPWRTFKERFIKFLIILGWCLLLAVAYKVTHIQQDYVAWDPFEILGIPPGSSITEIKRAYRRLSLKHHPDKEQGDAKLFMMISKAHAALTDDEARKNWELYGNPDGPGATSFGIALPSWIIEKENSYIVLGLYALVFMVALPTAVGIWWYRSVQYGGDQVLMATSYKYYALLNRCPYMILRRVIMTITVAHEFSKAHNSEIVERPSDNIETPMIIKELPNLAEKIREYPYNQPYAIKARTLLHAHLSRLPLPPNTLELDKLYIVKKCPYLIQDFIQCATHITMLAILGHVPRTPHLDTVENAMKLCRMIVQALWDNKSPLLQLPHITEDNLRYFTSRKWNIKNVQQLASMNKDDRRLMLRNLSDDQYCDIMMVISKMPLLTLEVKSEIVGDEDSGTITAGAIVTVTATLTRTPMSVLFDKGDENANEEDKENEQKSQNEANHAKITWNSKSKSKRKASGKVNKKLKKQKFFQPRKVPTPPVEVEEDKGSDSGHSEGGSNEQKASADDGSDEEGWGEFQDKVFKKEKILETKSKISHSVHCPYFPDDKQEYWWVYIVDRKRQTMVTVPLLITSLVNTEEVDLKFRAPSKQGIYNYTVVVRSDSYIDFDVTKSIKIDVKPKKEIKDLLMVWDIPEEEEANKEEESGVEDSDLLASDEEEENSDGGF